MERERFNEELMQKACGRSKRYSDYEAVAVRPRSVELWRGIRVTVATSCWCADPNQVARVGRKRRTSDRGFFSNLRITGDITVFLNSTAGTETKRKTANPREKEEDKAHEERAPEKIFRWKFPETVDSECNLSEVTCLPHNIGPHEPI